MFHFHFANSLNVRVLLLKSAGTSGDQNSHSVFTLPPMCGGSICHRYSPKSYPAAFKSPSIQGHPWLYSALTMKWWLSRWRKESTNRLLLWECILNYRYSVFRLGTCTVLEMFFILGTLISKVVWCFQKATKREENKLVYFYLYFSVVYMNKGIKRVVTFSQIAEKIRKTIL